MGYYMVQSSDDEMMLGRKLP